MKVCTDIDGLRQELRSIYQHFIIIMLGDNFQSAPGQQELNDYLQEHAEKLHPQVKIYCLLTKDIPTIPNEAVYSEDNFIHLQPSGYLWNPYHVAVIKHRKIQNVAYKIGDRQNIDIIITEPASYIKRPKNNSAIAPLASLSIVNTYQVSSQQMVQVEQEMQAEAIVMQQRQQETSRSHEKTIGIMEYTDFFCFCNHLQHHASNVVIKKKSIFRTQKHFNLMQDFFKRVQEDSEFCLLLAGRIFGLAYTYNQQETEKNFTALYNRIYGIHFFSVTRLIRYLFQHLDGINPETPGHEYQYQEVSLARERITKAVAPVMHMYNFFNGRPCPILKAASAPINNTKALVLRLNPYLYNKATNHRSFISSLFDNLRFNYVYVINEINNIPHKLLIHWILDDLSDEDFNKRIYACLESFVTDKTHDTFQQTLLQWTKVYCQEENTLAKLFSKFQFDLDNLKSILFIIMSRHRHGMQEFLSYLKWLEERNLWNNFYHIYFQYTDNVCELGECRSGVFDSIAQLTPTNDGPMPLAVKFCHHVLLFLVKQQPFIALRNIQLQEITDCWYKLKSIVLQVTSDEVSTDTLLQQWLDSICCSDGLQFGCIYNRDTLFDRLVTVFINAAAKNRLLEQMQLMTNLPLQDLNIAINNGLNVVAPEMQISLEWIETSSFAVTAEQLWDCVNNSCSNARLKRMLFRYLGTQDARESLVFYREILVTDDNLVLLAILALTSTGKNYHPHVLPKNFASIAQKFCDIELVEKFVLHVRSVIANKLQGTYTLFNLLFTEPLQTSISPIFTQRFDEKQLLAFLLLHADELKISLQTMQQDAVDINKLLHALVKSSWETDASDELYQALKDRYNIYSLLENLHIIGKFINIYQGFTKLNIADLTAVNNFIHSLQDLSMACDFLDRSMSAIFNQPIPSTQHVSCIVKFLQVTYIQDVVKIENKSIIDLLINYVLQDPMPKALDLWWGCCKKLLPNHAHIIIMLQPCLEKNESYDFLALAAEELSQTIELIVKYHAPISLIASCSSVLADLLAMLDGCTAHHVASLDIIIKNVGVDYLNLLQPHIMEPYLRAISSHINMLPQELLRSWLTTTPSLKENFTQWLRNSHSYERYTTNKVELMQQIQEVIHIKPLDDFIMAKPPKYWVQQIYNALTSFIAYMNNETIVYDGKKLRCLADEELSLLRREIIDKIRKHSDNHVEYSVLLLALACHAHEVVLFKSVRIPQVLCLLNAIFNPGNIFHQLDTGSGKSIVAALTAVLQQALGKSVDILTENKALAQASLQEFKEFYHILGIQCGEEIITSTSSYNDYIEGGIHYTSYAEMNLYELQMKLHLNTLATHRCGIFDEGDDAFTSTLQHNLALVLNSSNYTTLWQQALLDFVRSEIYVDNDCTESEIWHNFQEYVRLRNDAKFLEFVQQKSSIFHQDLQKAATVITLVEHKDYMTVIKHKGDKSFYYAAPIIETGTKRPDINASFEGISQPLLHLLCNEKPGLIHLYEVIEPAEIIITAVPKTCFDRYKKSGSLILLSATIDERKELYECLDVRIFRYPSYHPKIAPDPELKLTDSLHLQQQAVIERLNINPHLPSLIFTSSPREALEWRDFIKDNINANRHIQYYLGYDALGDTEPLIIARAVDEGCITIVTQSLSRGTNFIPHAGLDLQVINLCTKISKSEWIQLHGRTGRNGRSGARFDILNRADLSVEDAAVMRDNISQERYLKRKKMRLLHDVRDYVIDTYFLQLRLEITPILQQQQGLAADLITEREFHLALRDMNRDLEHKYLARNNDNEFLAWVIARQRRLLNDWIPETRFSNFTAIEPLVEWKPLLAMEQFYSMSQAQCLWISTHASNIWRKLGHKRVMNLEQDHIVPFYGYMQNKETFRTAFIEYLIKRQILGTYTEISASLTRFRELELKRAIEFTRSIVLPSFFMPINVKDFEELDAYCVGIDPFIQAGRWDDIPIAPYKQKFFNIINNLLTICSYLIHLGLYPAKVAMRTMLPDELLIYTDDIFNLLPAIIQLLQFIIKIQDSYLEVEFGEYLDIMRPFVDNNFLLDKLQQYLEKHESTVKVDLKHTLTTIFTHATKYRANTLQMMLTFDSGYEILQLLLHQDFVQQLAELQPLQQLLDRDFMALFKDSQSETIYRLLKAMAHPIFFTYVSALPETATFGDMVTWLNTDAAPVTMQPVLESFHAYQNDAPRIAQDANMALSNVRNKFILDEEKINNHLRQLYYHSPNKLFGSSNDAVIQFHMIPTLFIVTGIAIVAVVNSLYFSPIAIAVSLFLLAISLAYLLPKVTSTECEKNYAP